MMNSLKELLGLYHNLLTMSPSSDQLHMINSVCRSCADYLSSVSHDSKFSFDLFAKILKRSAKHSPTFEADLAAEYLSDLEKMATNLYLQPYRRKEFSCLETYSSYFIGLNKCLSDYGAILSLIGYQLDSDGNYFLPDDLIIDCDTLLSIAFDCFLACVECQLMHRIMVILNDPTVTWTDIIRCREQSIGGAQFCAETFLSRPRLSSVEFSLDSRPPKPPKDYANDDSVRPSDSHSSTLLPSVDSFSSIDSTYRSRPTQLTVEADVHTAPSAPQDPWSIDSRTWTPTDWSMVSFPKPFSEGNVTSFKNYANEAVKNGQHFAQMKQRPPDRNSYPESAEQSPLDKSFVVVKADDIEVLESEPLNKGHTTLNKRVNEISESLNGLKFHLDQARKKASHILTYETDCPRCRMYISKNVIVCPYCDWYFHA